MMLSSPPAQTPEKSHHKAEKQRSRRARSSSTEPQPKTSRQNSVTSTKIKRTTHARQVLKATMPSIAEPKTPHRDLEQHSESAIFQDVETRVDSAVPQRLMEKASLLSSPGASIPALTEDISMSESESDIEEKPAPPPRRKRLIDSLGVDPSRPPRKKSKTPSSSPSSSSSGSDSEDSHERKPASHAPTPVEIDSQSQHFGELRQAASQEAALRTLAKPVTGNVRPRITYSRQRSYLAEEVTDELAMFSQSLPSLPSPATGTRRRLAAVPLAAEEPESESQNNKSQTQTMKSIHELRAAGESRRFTDDVEELFGDIEATRPISTRRMGYVSVILMFEIDY